jgi:putative intracellular protease/amidase
MKPNAYLLVFDGLADWEPGLAMAEINKSKLYKVITVGFSTATITTMGGIRVMPDITIDQVSPDDAAIFIIPGGDMWEQQTDERISPLLNQLHSSQVAIAAICGATLELGRAGLLKVARHTSNAPGYLKALVPAYDAEHKYVEQPAVSDNSIITASGLGSVEFAYEIIRQLKIYSESDSQVWFDMFKHGVIPKEMQHEMGGGQ